MAAIAAVCITHLEAGDRILLPSQGYNTTRVLVERFSQHPATRSVTFPGLVSHLATRSRSGR